MLNFCKNSGNFIGVKSFLNIFALKLCYYMTTNKLLFDKENSNILIKIRRSVNRYLKTNIKSSSGFLCVSNDRIEDLKLDFVLEIESNNFNFNKPISASQISFKSISFQKNNQTLSFIKGYLSINNIVKVVELEVSLVSTEDVGVNENAFIEITGVIDKKDFEWTLQEYKGWADYPLSQNVNLVANLDFKNFSAN